MEFLWYCKKCLTLYKEDPGRRCSCGGRVNRTIQEMEEAYLDAEYHYSEEASYKDILRKMMDQELQEAQEELRRARQEKKTGESSQKTGGQKSDGFGQSTAPLGEKKKKETVKQAPAKPVKEKKPEKKPEKKEEAPDLSLIPGFEIPVITTVPDYKEKVPKSEGRRQRVKESSPEPAKRRWEYREENPEPEKHRFSKESAAKETGTEKSKEKSLLEELQELGLRKKRQ